LTFLTCHARYQLATGSTRGIIVSSTSSERRLGDGRSNGSGGSRRLFQRQRESNASRSSIALILAGARLAVAACRRRHLANVREIQRTKRRGKRKRALKALSLSLALFSWKQK